MYIYIHTYVYTCTYVYAHALSLCLSVSLSRSLSLSRNTYTRTHTHTHTHTQKRLTPAEEEQELSRLLKQFLALFGALSNLRIRKIRGGGKGDGSGREAACETCEAYAEYIAAESAARAVMQARH